MTRGDVVIVPFPFQDRTGEKTRPCVIVQSDHENRRLANTILVMVNGNLKDQGQATSLLIDPASIEGAGSGLKGPSIAKCCNVATVRQNRVLQVIGRLSPPLMRQLDDCLRAALGLS